MNSKNPHVEKAFEYANGVTSGQIPACKYVRLACRRHLSDLASSESEGFPYHFDAKKAARVCKFIELLPHTKGKWALKHELIVLQPWQCFLVCVIFGWVHKETGLRRFRKAYIEIPRKNGKSIWAAAVGLYMLAADDEHGAEVYAGATSEKQAWEVFRPAKQMAERTPEFLEAFGVAANASNLNITSNGSRFEPVIGKPGDGASPSCAIVDEYHEHPDDTLVDTMATGMGAREQPLLLEVTTAGSDIAGPCYAQRIDAIRMLEGSVDADNLFACIWTIDEGEDWTTEAVLRKANPNYDISVSGDWLKVEQRNAINSSRKQNTFKTKHLNAWVTARAAWMNMEHWRRCGDPTLERSQFSGLPRYKGLDLSSKLDLTADVDVFCNEIDGVPHFYAFCRAYVPETTAQEPEKQHYHGWIHDRHLIATEGDIIDYDKVRENIVSDDAESSVSELGFDPWGATQLATDLMESGIECIEVPMRVQYLSEPMKMLEAYVKSGQFHHDNNPVLNWAMSNVVVKVDANDNIFPRKERPESKIDPAVALVIAMSRAIVAEDRTSVYETRGVRSL